MITLSVAFPGSQPPVKGLCSHQSSWPLPFERASDEAAQPRRLVRDFARPRLDALLCRGERCFSRRMDGKQRRLQQAAKMEAIGRLAGGIAHDFNNILGAILGYGELAQSNLGQGSAARRHVDQVMLAGTRGKGLVDSILAFSRSGIDERVPLHLQSVVKETLDLLAPSLPVEVRLQM